MDTQQVQFYEVMFDDGFSIAIKGVRKPSIEEANTFCRYKDGTAVEVIEISEPEVRNFFDCGNIENWPVFGLQT